MDTLTHTLAGLVLGECAARSIPASRSGLGIEQRRRVYLPLLMVGSNLPDGDFLYSLITGSKLDYLLHHRGHTHTIFGVLLGAALLFTVTWAYLRRARSSPQRADHYWLGIWALIGPVLHVTMDATNTYGVHPFWPISARWWYGDAVFIVEPLFWAAALPVLGLIQSNWLRLLLATVIAAALALLFSSELIIAPLRVLLVAMMLGGLLLGYRCAPRTALLVAAGTWSAVTALFVVAHGFAARAVDEFTARTDPRALTLDRILTPLPTNPLCWEVILVQVRSTQYTLRRGTLALAPLWLEAQDCPNRDLDTLASAPLYAVAAANTPQWQWFGEWRAPRAELKELIATYCEAAAFLKFSRAPWWSNTVGRMQLGDLRYDREPQAGFAEIELRGACPPHLPPWRPPRSDLLAQPGP